jgi:hypothetical protein
VFQANYVRKLEQKVMKRFIYILFCIGCFLIQSLSINSPVFLNAQTPEWVYQYVEPMISDVPYAIDADSSGNNYTTGYLSAGLGIIKLNSTGEEKWVYCNDTLGAGAYGQDIVECFKEIYVAGYSQSVSGNKDLIIANVDTSGQAQWILRDTMALEANAVSVSQSHRIYAAGLTHMNSFDVFCIKLDSLGNEKWQYVYDGPAGSYDEATCLTIDENENIYVGGYSTGIGTAEDFIVIKIDSAGNEKWVYRYDGPANYMDDVSSIILDSLSNIYMTGRSWGIDWDFCVVKIDSTGQEKWVYRYNGSADMADFANNLTIDDMGNIYVCGNSAREDTTSLFTVIKIDSAGNERWCFSTPGPYDMGGGANSITLDGLGGIYVGGYLRNASLRPQIAVIKLDSLGDTLWTYIHPHVPPSPFADVTHDIVADVSGNIYVAGRIAVASFNDDIVVLKFEDQFGAKEANKENIMSSNNTVSILRGGVEIQPRNSGDLRIYDVLGRMVVRRFLSGDKKYFFSLSSGIYFITIESGDTLKCRKVVIL